MSHPLPSSRPARAHPAEPLPADPSRRRLLGRGVALGLGLGVGLSGCGSGDVVSALSPSRFIVFGDGLSDLGQSGARYTVNDGSINIWAERLAARYGKSVRAQSAGGLGYAQGHAPDAPLPRSLPEQVDAFLAANRFEPQDVSLLNLPMADVLAPAAAVKAGRVSEAAALAQISQSAAGHVATVRRLIAAGARYIVVCGVYDLGKSPWAAQQNQKTFLSTASLRFNDSFKVDAVQLATHLLYVDAAFVINRNTDPKLGPAYGFSNFDAPLCTTPSALGCTDATLASSAKSAYVFADAIHLTPASAITLGDYAYDQLRARW